MPSDDPGVFGSVLRRKEPSVMLIYGTKAKNGFETDWVATHELFHLGNPPTQGRYPWFVEGFTTYYTELLRARSKALPENVVWGTLASSLRDYCQPEGTTLLERSKDLARNHDWMRIYWAGACLALRVDVAIRVQSKGTRSLDDVLRELRKGDPLDEEDLIAAFDTATGSELASKHVTERKQLPIEDLLTQLGVGPVKGDVAVLKDDAPLSKVRQAMSRW
jgi:predicted metalloprotease with PDZ domain